MTKKEIKEALLSYVSIKRSLGDMDKVSKLIEAYFAEEPVNDDKWISVEDRLPEELEYVLLFDAAAKFYTIGFYSLGKWHCVDGNWNVKSFTHWMPLPEPPKTKQL